VQSTAASDKQRHAAQTSGGSVAPAGSTPVRDAATAWVEAFAEGWRAPVGADAFADHFDRWLDPQVRLIQAQLPPVVGHAAFREQFARPLFALVPDLHGTVEGWASSGDTVYVELRLEGTLGGRPLTLRTCDRVKLRDGLAVERVAYVDPIPLLRAVARTPRAWPRFIRQQLSARRRPT
jgi:ketosteroid isomerase-like protein